MTLKERGSVPELSPLSVALIACADEASVLDALVRTPAAHACRIAPDELWLLGAPVAHDGLLEHARAAVATTGGIAESQSDAWSAFALDWPDAADVFARLSAVPLPAVRPSFIQCELAHVPGKAIALDSHLCLLVPAPVGHHLEERIEHGCRDLGVERGPSIEFTPPAGAPA